MKLKVRFDAFDLREALIEAAAESVPSDIRGDDFADCFADEMMEAREDRYREALAPWIDSSGQESGRDRIVVEFDLEAEPPTARVLGGVEILRACVERPKGNPQAGEPRSESVITGYTAEELLLRAVRFHVKYRPRLKPAWSALKRPFGLGSSRSVDLCLASGLDPDTGEPLDPKEDISCGHAREVEP